MLYKGIAIVISLFSLLITNNEEHFQQAHYYVFKSNKVIGHMWCSRLEKNDIVEYTTESNVNISLLVDISIYNKVHSSFINGVLHIGTMQRKVNGKQKADTHIEWNKDKYLITTTEDSNELKLKIYFTTGCLMYVEPEHVKEIYSENFRQFVTIQQIAPHKYALHLPDGKDNYYTYKNGVCVEVEVPTALATVFIRPANA